MNKFFKKILIAVGALSTLSISAVTAFAESASEVTSQANSNNTPGGINQWLYYGIMIVVFLLVGYFFLVRPEKKRKKEAENLRDNLKPGNRITTIGGIVGTVESVTDEEIYLTNGLVLKRWALRSIDETSDDSTITYYEDEEETENTEEKE